MQRKATKSMILQPVGSAHYATDTTAISDGSVHDTTSRKPVLLLSPIPQAVPDLISPVSALDVTMSPGNQTFMDVISPVSVYETTEDESKDVQDVDNSANKPQSFTDPEIIEETTENVEPNVTVDIPSSASFQNEMTVISKALKYLEEYKCFRDLHAKKYDTQALEEMVKRQIRKPLEDAYYDNLLLTEKLRAREELYNELRQQRLAAIAAHHSIANQKNYRGNNPLLPADYVKMEQENLEQKIFLLTDSKIKLEQEKLFHMDEVKKLNDVITKLKHRIQDLQHNQEMVEFKCKDKIRKFEYKINQYKDQLKLRDEKIEKQFLTINSLTKEVNKEKYARSVAEKLTEEYKFEMETHINGTMQLRNKISDLEGQLQRQQIATMTQQGQCLMIEEEKQDLRRRYDVLVENLDDIVMKQGIVLPQDHRYDNKSSKSIRPCLSKAAASRVIITADKLDNSSYVSYKAMAVVEDKYLEERKKANAFERSSKQYMELYLQLDEQTRKYAALIEMLTKKAEQGDKSIERLIQEKDNEIRQLVAQNADLLVQLDEETKRFKFFTKNQSMMGMGQDPSTISDILLPNKSILDKDASNLNFISNESFMNPSNSNILRTESFIDRMKEVMFHSEQTHQASPPASDQPQVDIGNSKESQSKESEIQVALGADDSISKADEPKEVDDNAESVHSDSNPSIEDESMQLQESVQIFKNALRGLGIGHTPKSARCIPSLDTIYEINPTESGRESYQSSVMNSYVSSSSIKNADDEDDDMLFTNNNDNDSSKEAKTNLGDIIARSLQIVIEKLFDGLANQLAPLNSSAEIEIEVTNPDETVHGRYCQILHDLHKLVSVNNQGETDETDSDNYQQRASMELKHVITIFETLIDASKRNKSLNQEQQSPRMEIIEKLRGQCNQLFGSIHDHDFAIHRHLWLDDMHPPDNLSSIFDDTSPLSPIQSPPQIASPSRANTKGILNRHFHGSVTATDSSSIPMIASFERELDHINQSKSVDLSKLVDEDALTHESMNEIKIDTLANDLPVDLTQSQSIRCDESSSHISMSSISKRNALPISDSIGNLSVLQEEIEDIANIYFRRLKAQNIYKDIDIDSHSSHRGKELGLQKISTRISQQDMLSRVIDENGDDFTSVPSRRPIPPSQGFKPSYRSISRRILSKSIAESREISEDDTTDQAMTWDQMWQDYQTNRMARVDHGTNGTGYNSMDQGLKDASEDKAHDPASENLRNTTRGRTYPSHVAYLKTLERLGVLPTLEHDELTHGYDMIKIRLDQSAAMAQQITDNRLEAIKGLCLHMNHSHGTKSSYKNQSRRINRSDRIIQMSKPLWPTKGESEISTEQLTVAGTIRRSNGIRERVTGALLSM